MGQIHQEDLRQIGANLQLKPLDPAAWNNYVIQTRTWGLSFAMTPPVNLHPSSVLAVCGRRREQHQQLQERHVDVTRGQDGR